MHSRILTENDVNDIIGAAYNASKNYTDTIMHEQPRSGDHVWGIHEQITYHIVTDGEIISEYNHNELIPKTCGLGEIVYQWAKKEYGNGQLGMGIYVLVSNTNPGNIASIFPFLVTPYATSRPITMKLSSDTESYAMTLRLINADFDTYIESITISTDCVRNWGVYLGSSKGPGSEFTADLSYDIYKM